MSDQPTLLHVIKGVEIYQDPVDAKWPNRIHFIADLSVDVDGARHSYRLDNDHRKALDDIHASAGYPHSSWQNVLVPDPNNPDRPFVDEEGYCVSMTSYQREGFGHTDRRRYVDAVEVAYSVLPGIIRKRCRGIVCGCSGRITDVRNGHYVDTVCADFSGYSVGEASQRAAQTFGPQWSARNGDDRRIYLYEFFPDVPAVINGEVFELKPLKSLP